jgi:hypothetical protein
VVAPIAGRATRVIVDTAKERLNCTKNDHGADASSGRDFDFLIRSLTLSQTQSARLFLMLVLRKVAGLVRVLLTESCEPNQHWFIPIVK